jgi:hypothetical protein
MLLAASAHDLMKQTTTIHNSMYQNSEGTAVEPVKDSAVTNAHSLSTYAFCLSLTVSVFRALFITNREPWCNPIKTACPGELKHASNTFGGNHITLSCKLTYL